MIERKDEGPVAVLTMAHGPVNAMDLDLLLAITETFNGLTEDPAGAVVLTGTGRSFCAGVNLRAYLDGGEEYSKRFLPALSEAFMAVFTHPRPVVAAVNGHAIAGGAVLACAADQRIMAAGGGQIGTPELKVGVGFPRAALDVVVYAVGERVARHLVYGAHNVGPAQALEAGLVDEVVEPDELLAHAVRSATALAEGIPGDSFGHTKLQLRRHIVERIVNYQIDEDPAAARLWRARVQDGWMANFLANATGKKPSGTAR